jgi:hypothetical protein
VNRHALRSDTSAVASTAPTRVQTGEEDTHILADRILAPDLTVPLRNSIVAFAPRSSPDFVTVRASTRDRHVTRPSHSDVSYEGAAKLPQYAASYIPYHH